MTRPKLAVWKFASCDGCQLTLLDCEDELLALAEAVEISQFLEATSEIKDGPYDISLVEGSITTDHDLHRIREVRAQSEVLIAIGACATAGGIQALRNFADVDGYTNTVYAHPDYIETLEHSHAIADHVQVDMELRGCPVSKSQLIELITATLAARKPHIPNVSQCVECKRAETACVMVSQGIPCMGPVTQAGCGNLCPKIGRGCYGCFGPVEHANTAALSAEFARLGLSETQTRDKYRYFNAAAPAFANAGDRA
ncbi:MAG: oxidoreductase [Rhodobacter sp.]|nr:oxidoreductase [Rhodobacter sp.]